MAIKCSLDVCRHHPSAIDLLLSDVVMPNMNGPDLADEVLALDCLNERGEKTRVLFISGYTEAQIAEHGTLRRGFRTLSKPFTPDQH